MIYSAICTFFSRLDTYLAVRRTHKSAKCQEARDREAREQRWAKANRQGPYLLAQPPGESEDYNDETEDQLRPMRTEQQIKRKIAVTRKSRAPWQRSLETLELGRVQAAEMFYRM